MARKQDDYSTISKEKLRPVRVSEGSGLTRCKPSMKAVQYGDVPAAKATTCFQQATRSKDHPGASQKLLPVFHGIEKNTTACRVWPLAQTLQTALGATSETGMATLNQLMGSRLIQAEPNFLLTDPLCLNRFLDDTRHRSARAEAQTLTRRSGITAPLTEPELRAGS